MGGGSKTRSVGLESEDSGSFPRRACPPFLIAKYLRGLDEARLHWPLGYSHFAAKPEHTVGAHTAACQPREQVPPPLRESSSCRFLSLAACSFRADPMHPTSQAPLAVYGQIPLSS